MTIDQFIIVVYCVVDEIEKKVLEQCRNQSIRKAGFAPKLSDVEAITIILVGEWLGLHTDKAIYRYFKQHYQLWFPKLPDRSTFVRQVAKLWSVMAQVQTWLLVLMGAWQERVHVIDGFPMIVSGPNRKPRTFRGVIAKGYCAAKKMYFRGFKGHLLITEEGIITAVSVTAANVDEREAAWDVLDNVVGLLLGDKGYISEFFKAMLQQRDIKLWTPPRINMKDQSSFALTPVLGPVRRRIETVIGQLASRFEIERVRARDLWHLTARVVRKVLAHTVGVFLAKSKGLPPLQFDRLIAV